MIDGVWLHEFGNLQVVQLSVLRDNYSYLIHDKETGATAVLDPADDPRIVEELRQRGWLLHAIWNTHWHADHCGGNAGLLDYARNSSVKRPEVAAYSRKKIAECSRELRSGDVVSLGAWNFAVHEVPCHTLDHLMFVCIGTNAGKNFSLAFCGDTLFSLGCGRLFEGTAAQLAQSLELIAGLPQQTLLFCAHEYTRANLRFALSLESENRTLRQFDRYLALPANRSKATVPSRLAFELAANPFLRVRQKKFSAAMEGHFSDWPSRTTAERLGYLRKMKDLF
ncbi:hydroxyacylglutathione hydrolase [Candidatus Haliotispira prima]|uniref:Hydroxyacylglutathione hydrolase n=1 Tax=Candidatus Haliotispira prima TaxID=3034016 RepID=A0ABY8MG30_9SPIO|nr:hydroxyacylglutathione hydrolase [Candidatus Haliotispira prima]